MDRRKYSAEVILQRIIDQAMDSLEELAEARDAEGNSDYVEGAISVWDECLEIVQEWEGAEEAGLDWDVEEEFPPK